MLAPKILSWRGLISHAAWVDIAMLAALQN